MKKFLIIVALILMCAASVQAQTTTTSAVNTADAAITVGAGEYYGIVISSGGTTVCTASVYDGTSTSGTKLVPTIINQASNPDTRIYAMPAPVSYFTGLYVDITGASGCSYKVIFRAR